MSERSGANDSVAILVVEDSPTQADYLKHLLERESYVLRIAENGKQAFSMIAQFRPDLVLSDIVMPEMDGFELCRRLRAREDLRLIPVILTTALSDSKEVVRALQAGADAFIRKPFEDQYLLAQVRQVLENSKRSRTTAPKAGHVVALDGRTYVVSDDSSRALGLLLTTYQAAVEQNRELIRARDSLAQLNESLEERVRERTASLSAEIERRKAAEQMLAEDRQLLRTVLDAIPESICLKDARLRYTTANSAFVRSLGATPPRFEGKSDYDFFPRERAEHERALDEQALSRGTTIEVEERRQEGRRDRDVRIVRIPVTGEAGKTNSILVIEWDITEQKRSEDKLRDERYLLRTLIDSVPDLIYFKDTQLRFVLSNVAYLRFLGVDREEELIGKTDTDFFTPSVARELAERETALIRTRAPVYSLEEELVDPDGNSIVLETTKVPIVDANGIVTGLVGISRDVTERRALLSRLMDLANFPSESPHPIARISLDGRVLYANEPARPIVTDSRYSRGGVITEPTLRYLDSVVSEDKSVEVEGELGSRMFRFVIVPINKRGYINVYGFDITEQKTLERRLLQASKMEAVGRMAGGVAHDFNNMLAVINGFSEYLVGKLAGNDAARSIVAKIKEAGNKAAAITTRLLAFSRDRPQEVSMIDLNGSVTRLEDMIRRVLSRDVELTLALDPSLWPIAADPTSIDQVILNLAINARDAISAAGSITIMTKNATLDSTYLGEQFEVRPGEYACLSIADTGCGMSEEVKARIFEPFFTTKPEGRGTGLGLAVVYGAVRDARGDIRISSMPDAGTTFEIYLPRAG